MDASDAKPNGREALTARAIPATTCQRCCRLHRCCCSWACARVHAPIGVVLTPTRGLDLGMVLGDPPTLKSKLYDLASKLPILSNP